MPLLKICGLADIENAREVEKYCDYIGIIVDPNAKSPRRVDEVTARNIVRECVNAKPVAVILTREGLDVALRLDVSVVQLHTTRGLSELADYAVQHGLRIAPVLVAESRVLSEETVRRFVKTLRQYCNYIEYVLIDADKSLQPLSNGLKLELDTYRLFVDMCHEHGLRSGVAGGVNVENVDLLLKLRPDLVDVSSGVEVRPGIKDLSLVKELARKVRGLRL